MLPVYETKLPKNFVIAKQPSKTYRLDREKGRILGMTDGLEAVEQTVYQILNTERYETLIFSWNYGTELKSLYGRPHPYVQSELKRRVKEALLQDDRIKGVDGFTFGRTGSKLSAIFTVHTTKGALRAEMEVTVNV